MPTSFITVLARQLIDSGLSRRNAGESLEISLVAADGGGFDAKGDFNSWRVYGLAPKDRNAVLAEARRISGIK